jgi:type I restriction enzyme R subunit
LVKLRQFAALLAKLVSARRAAYRDERETFEETLRQLSYERIIPRRLRTSSILSGRSETTPCMRPWVIIAAPLFIDVCSVIVGRQPGFDRGTFVPPRGRRCERPVFDRR